MDDAENWMKRNPEPWNRQMHVLYLEQPAGVGFSIGVNEKDRSSSDTASSVDGFAAI